MSDFLQQRHAGYTTKGHEVEAIINRVTSSPIVSIEKIVRGYDNEVYAVRISKNEQLIVRIRRYGHLPMADEAWAIEAARAVGAPVPEVLLCESRPVDGAEREVMIQRLLPGRSLEDIIATLTDDQCRHCYVQAAAALARIHSVPVEGFYMRHHGVWDFPNWEAISTVNERERAAEREGVVKLGVTDAEFDTLVSTLDQLQSRFPCYQPVLLHGDYTPDHWLFDDALNLVGIIDFGQFQGGVPMVDIADMVQSATTATPVEIAWLREGYGPAELWNDFPLRYLAHAIGFTIGSLNHHASIGDTDTAEELLVQLRGLLKQIEAIS